MKKLLDLITSHIWIQIIAVCLCGFSFVLIAGNCLGSVEATGKQLVRIEENASSSSHIESSTQEGEDETSGAFGNWKDFSDYYVEPSIIRPDPPRSSAPASESSEPSDPSDSGTPSVPESSESNASSSEGSLDVPSNPENSEPSESNVDVSSSEPDIPIVEPSSPADPSDPASESGPVPEGSEPLPEH
jgi:hypothetical protein